MTVSTTINKIAYTGNGITRNWDFTFPVLEETDMSVYLTDLTTEVTTLLTSNYDVDLLNSYVVYPTVASGLPLLTSDYKITLARELDLVQETDYANQGAFPSTAIENNEDRVVMMVQQVQEQVDRTALKDIGTDLINFDDVQSITFSDSTVQTSAGVGSASSVQALDGTTVLDGGTDGTDSTYIGDVTGNLTGNADTVTNGVYITGTQTITGDKTFDGDVDFSGSGGAFTCDAQSLFNGTSEFTDDLEVKNLTVNDTTDASSPTTGAVQIAGGLGVAKKVYVGTELVVGNTSNSDTKIKVTSANNTKTGIELRGDLTGTSGIDFHYDGSVNAAIWNTVESSVATERMRMELSTGQVGIGNDSPDELLVVGDDSNDDTRIKILSTNQTTAGIELRADLAGTSGYNIYYDGTGVGSANKLVIEKIDNLVITEVFSSNFGLDHNFIGTLGVSNLTGGAINLTANASGEIIRDPSDARTKENIINIENPIDKVMALNGRAFNYKESANMGTDPKYGLIADEVAAVDNKLTVTSTGTTRLSEDLEIDNMMSIDHAGLIALLIESVKELNSKIIDLKSII